jgi:Fe-S oxidoreductase
MKYEEIVHRCFRCGYCKFTEDYHDLNCPTYRKFRFETFSPGGRMWLIRAWLNNEIKTSERLQQILFSCATCANCVEHCVFTFKDDLVNIFIAAREKLVDEQIIPPAVRDYFKNIHISGNPYKEPEAERGKWAKGTGIKPFDAQEYLFYVGCVGSYDERAKKSPDPLGRCCSNQAFPSASSGKRSTVTAMR